MHYYNHIKVLKIIANYRMPFLVKKMVILVNDKSRNVSSNRSTVRLHITFTTGDISTRLLLYEWFVSSKNTSLLNPCYSDREFQLYDPG